MRHFGFPGHAVTGREFTTAITRAVGRELAFKPMTWWLIHLGRPFVPMCRELSEIAYLWHEPHRIEGTKLSAPIGDVPHTPLGVAVMGALQDLHTAAEAPPSCAHHRDDPGAERFINSLVDRNSAGGTNLLIDLWHSSSCAIKLY